MGVGALVGGRPQDRFPVHQRPARGAGVRAACDLTTRCAGPIKGRGEGTPDDLRSATGTTDTFLWLCYRPKKSIQEWALLKCLSSILYDSPGALGWRRSTS